MGRQATVVDFEPSTSIRSRSLRALHYEDGSGDAKLVNLWAGTDYKIVGTNPYYEDLKKLEYEYADVVLAHPHPEDDDDAASTKNYDTMLQGQAFFDNDSDSEEENEIEDVVEIRVPPGPLGLLLDSGIQQCAVVHGFTTLPSGGQGPVEAHGGVHAGMYIIGINETNASLMSLTAVTQLLGRLARKDKVIRFAVFRPGSASPKMKEQRHLDSDDSDEEEDDEDDDDSSAAQSSVTSTASSAQQLPPPVPLTPSKPSTTGVMGGFTSRFASLAASVAAKTTSSTTPRGSMTAAPSLPSETECLHCGVPTSVHTSAACPYK